MKSGSQSKVDRKSRAFSVARLFPLSGKKPIAVHTENFMCIYPAGMVPNANPSLNAPHSIQVQFLPLPTLSTVDGCEPSAIFTSSTRSSDISVTHLYVLIDVYGGRIENSLSWTA